jgi:hypothetical protein
MTGAAAAGAGGAAAYAAMVNAIKASGAIIQVEPNDFMDMLARNPDPLVVFSPAGMFSKNQYLTAYKGLFFYTKNPTPLALPTNIELVQAKKIWIPN